MAALIDRVGARSIVGARSAAADHFVGLSPGSSSASRSRRPRRATVWGRVCDAFGGEAPTPEQLIGAEDVLRGCGLSGRKASYVVGIARGDRRRRAASRTR